MEAIDITPTWKALMPVLIDILQNGSEKGKREVRLELMRLAVAVDSQNAKGKKEAV